MSFERRKEILELATACGALRFGDFQLSSGQRSSYYFDGRLVTLHPRGALLIGREVLEVVRVVTAQAVGGLTLGADPMVAAAVALSSLEGAPVSGFIVRNEPKAHGTQQLIEGPLAQGSRVVIVDDVCTTGGSLLRAIRAVEALSCQVTRVAVVLDRRQGGSDALRRQGYGFTAFLEAEEMGSIRVGGEA